MNQLRLPNKTEAPPGMFQYVIPGLPSPSNKIGPVTSIQQCIRDTTARYAANARLVPNNLPDLIEQQNCERLAPGYCHYENGVSGNKPYRLTWSQLLTGTMTVGSWLMQGRTKVAIEQAEARARVCSACRFNVTNEGCSGCKTGEIRDVVAQFLAPNEKTTIDHLLNGCSICGCSLKLKVWLLRDTILKFITSEKVEEFPDWCWMKTEGNLASPVKE